ncbi:MAG: TonB-dependent receptor [Bacteroidota bacterium]
MKKVFLMFALFMVNLSLSMAQMAATGIISGKVLEKDSGFEIIGGNVLVVGSTGLGGVTDLDGSYTIKIEPGTYSIEFSYIGFATQTIEEVVVRAGEITSLDVQLGEEAVNLDIDVTVTAKAYRNTESAVLLLQKKSPIVMDGISADQISKGGDNDVASAVRRVTGVTVEGGKYVYVRGLGDRYSKTSVNGAEVPGLDPNRNTVQMDLFPTNLIDNILVYKTFSPNLPADFTGGYVDIITKDFPEQFTFNVSASLGYNSLANFNNNFLSSPGSDTDVLGFDDGQRAIPDLIEQNQDNFPEFAEGLNNAQRGQLLADMTRSFNNTWLLENNSNFLNYSLSTTIGNQKQLFGKPLGMIAALSYNRSYSGYEGGAYGIYELTDNVENASGLTTQLLLDDQSGSEDVLWGAMAGLNYKLSSNQKIGLTIMHNQSATSTTRFLEGKKFRDDQDDIFQTRTWQFLQRSLSTVQLRGKHVFPDHNNFEINWQSSYSLSQQDEPDLRYFTSRYNPLTDRFRIKPSSDNVPTRFYRDMEQSNWDNKVNFSLPFSQWAGLKSKLDFGLSYVFRDRDFRETRYNFNNNAFAIPNGDIFAYFNEANLIAVDDVAGGYTNNGNGIYVANNFDPRNNYLSDQSVAAAFAMIELPLTDKLRAITGVRVEQTIIRLETQDTMQTLDRYPFLDGKERLLDNLDVLPSLNLNYDVSDNMKVRFAYTRTLARPSFRELAPFASFAVDGGFIFVGNPELKRTLIDNVDLRWEYYPRAGEIISLSAFYKNFTNPIERTFNPQAPNTELTYQNVDNAYLLGGELEMRKKLDFISPRLEGFSLGTNFSYIYSRTDISEEEMILIRAFEPDAKTFRRMFGQAPFVINALLSYKGTGGTRANLTFNLVGDRISVVTRGATPNYFLQGQPSLNFNISHDLNSQFSIKLSANNLLDAEYREVVTFKGIEYPVSTYRLGRTFSLGVKYNLAR